MEIITFNAARIQTFPHQRWAADIREQWTNANVTSADDGEPILTPSYWAMLYWRNNRPVVFRKAGRYDTSIRGDLTVALNGVLKLCEEGSVTGDVVLYRSAVQKHSTAEKYPLANNGTYIIYTGLPAWILSANPLWREQTEDDGFIFDPDYEKFRRQFPAFQKLHTRATNEVAPMLPYTLNHRRRVSRNIRNLANQQEQLNLRLAYVWGMLTVNERNGLYEQFQWESIMEAYTEPQRAGLLMWKEGKLRLWWDCAQGMSNVSHWMGVTPGASDFEGAGLRIDDNGRFVEAND